MQIIVLSPLSPPGRLRGVASGLACGGMKEALLGTYSYSAYTIKK